MYTYLIPVLYAVAGLFVVAEVVLCEIELRRFGGGARPEGAGHHGHAW